MREAVTRRARVWYWHQWPDKHATTPGSEPVPRACGSTERQERRENMRRPGFRRALWMGGPECCVARSRPIYKTWYIIFRVSPLKCSLLRFLSNFADLNLLWGHSPRWRLSRAETRLLARKFILALWGLTFGRYVRCGRVGRPTACGSEG